MRLRQVVMVAADLAAVEHRIEHELGVERCHRDPGVATFGLRNALFPVGDQLLEVVSPIEPGTTAGRLLDKRGGDGGYMVMLQVDDLGRFRTLASEAGARMVFETSIEGISEFHLHPADVGGAILAIAETDVWDEWQWAGPVWRDHIRTDTVSEVVAVEIEADDPAAMAARWAEVLGLEVVDDTTVRLPDAGAIEFVPAGDRGEGVAGFVLRAAGPEQMGETTICGCRFRLVA